MRFLLRYTRIMKHRSLLPGAVWLVISGAFLSFAQNNPVERYAAEGQAALAAGRYLDAEKAFEKLRELEPGVAEIHANLGLIYFEERKFEEAVRVLRQPLKLKPTLTKTDNLLGLSLSETGPARDRKSTRLNSSHGSISYDVVCWKKTR